MQVCCALIRSFWAVPACCLHQPVMGPYCTLFCKDERADAFFRLSSLLWFLQGIEQHQHSADEQFPVCMKVLVIELQHHVLYAHVASVSATPEIPCSEAQPAWWWQGSGVSCYSLVGSSVDWVSCAGHHLALMLERDVLGPPSS